MDEVMHSATMYLKREGFVVRDYFSVQGGYTNQLYCLRSLDGRNIILKKYYPNNQQHLIREFEMLRYLQALGFKNTPIACHKDDGLNYALYSFAEGKQLPFYGEQVRHVTRPYLDQMVVFMISLHTIKPSKSNRHFFKAIGACFGVNEYVKSIEANLCKAERVGARSSKSADLDINGVLIREAAEVIRYRIKTISQSSAGDKKKLPRSYWRLSPVDFGSHNILVHHGTSSFIDFEEAGWDDPMQLVAYVTPALSAAHKKYLIDAYLAKTPLPPYRHLSAPYDSGTTRA